VHRACDELLADARLTVDQHRGARRRGDLLHLIEYGANAARASDDCACAQPGQLVAQPIAFLAHVAASQHAFDDVLQLFTAERLLEQVVRAQPHRLNRGAHVGVPGQDDDARGIVRGHQGGQDLEPVALGHVQVQQNHVGTLSCGLFQGLAPGTRFQGPPTRSPAETHQAQPDPGIVVGNEDQRGHPTNSSSLGADP